MPSEKTNFPRESTMKEMANALAMIAVAPATRATSPAEKPLRRSCAAGWGRGLSLWAAV